MQKENNRDLSKGLEVSVHSHSSGLDGLCQAARLLSPYPNQQSDLLPAATWIHFRENPALPLQPRSAKHLKTAWCSNQALLPAEESREGRALRVGAAQHRLSTCSSSEIPMILFLGDFGSPFSSPTDAMGASLPPEPSVSVGDLITSLP